MNVTNPVQMFEISESCENFSNVLIKDQIITKKINLFSGLLGLLKLNFKKKEISEKELNPIEIFQVSENVKFQKIQEINEIHKRDKILSDKNFNAWIENIQNYTSEKYFSELNN